MAHELSFIEQAASILRKGMRFIFNGLEFTFSERLSASTVRVDNGTPDGGFVEVAADARVQVGSMFAVGATPWHNEGTLLEFAPTLDEALVLAGMHYTVEKRPTFRLQADGGLAENALAFVTVRTDTQGELGSVGKDYVPLHNADAMRVLEPLLDSGVALLETGGTLRGGADAWLLARFDVARFGPICREVFADEVVPFALVRVNHSGKRGISVAKTPIRVVCANTLGATDADIDAGVNAVTVRHTGDAQARLLAASEQLFVQLVERYEVLAANYRALKSSILTSAQFEALVLDGVAPHPLKDPTFNPEAKMAATVIQRAEARRGVLQQLWHGGKGHVGDGSAWEAYNGVVEALDHDVQGLWPTRGGVWRTASLLDGQLASLKQRTLQRLAAHAAA